MLPNRTPTRKQSKAIQNCLDLVIYNYTSLTSKGKKVIIIIIIIIQVKKANACDQSVLKFANKGLKP